MDIRRLTKKQYMAIGIIVVASAVSCFHLTNLGEGDIFQTAEDILAVLLFFE